MTLEKLINTYLFAIKSNEDAVKKLTDILNKINQKKNESFEDEIKRRTRLLDVRTKIINKQIEIRKKELNDLY